MKQSFVFLDMVIFYLIAPFSLFPAKKRKKQIVFHANIQGLYFGTTGVTRSRNNISKKFLFKELAKGKDVRGMKITNA